MRNSIALIIFDKINDMKYVFFYLVILLIIGYLIKVKTKNEYNILEGAFFTNVSIFLLSVGIAIIYLFIKYW